jgi:integrase
MHSPKFQSYAYNTQVLWGKELAFAERPDTLGALSVYEIRPALVQAFLDGLADRPGKQVAARAALRQLERWALVRDKLPHHITTGTEVTHSNGGHMPWTEGEVRHVELHGRRDIANAITLGVNTGQRCSDLVRMRREHLEYAEGRLGVNVTQRKTGKQLWVPATKQLGEWLTTSSSDFLITSQGKPWPSAKALSQAWTYERNTNPALAAHKEAGLVMHGLRAAACVRLSRVGANTRQIAAMVGMSEDVVARYCRFSRQKDDALAAVRLLDKSLI